MKSFLSVFILTFMIFPLFAAGQRDTGAPFRDCCIEEVFRIHQREVVHIGVIADNAPFSYQDELNVWQGYDVYFARRLAVEILGRDERFLRLIPVTQENWSGLLDSDELDFVLGFVSGSEWNGLADFSIPFRRTEDGTYAVAVRKGYDGLIMWLNDVISRRLDANFFHQIPGGIIK